MSSLFYTTKTWRPLETILGSWRFLQSELSGMVVGSQTASGYYEVFKRTDCPPLLKPDPGFDWESIKFDGYLSTQHPFDKLEEIISRGSEFRGIGHTVSFYVRIGWEERGFKQSEQHHDKVQIWFQEGETKLNFRFGTSSAYGEHGVLSGLVRQIEEKTCFRIGDIQVSPYGAQRPIDPSLHPKLLAEGLATITELIGYNRIFYSGWTLTCPVPEDSKIKAIECYNRATELKIPAERYELEVVSRYENWDAVDNIQPLCGPNDRLLHPLGYLGLPKKRKLGFFFQTSAEGHQLVIQTAKGDLSGDLVSRLESLGIDFTRSFTREEMAKE